MDFEISSTVLLLAIAVVNWEIYRLRHRPLSLLRDPARIWALFAVGFVFLAADEYFSIHENTDRLIHQLLRMQETGLTDRIDDVLVGLYGIVGGLLVYGSRKEFFGQSQALKFIIGGFVLLALMVVCDITTSRSDNDLLSIIIADPTTRGSIAYALRSTEDISKILGELSFLLGFLYVYTALKGASARPAKVVGNGADVIGAFPHSPSHNTETA